MSEQTTIVIGVDCATQPKKVGLARGALEPDGTARLTDATQQPSHDAIAATVAGWVQPDRLCLIALDAPLGWPSALGATLATHEAGQTIATPPNALFRRATDRFVKAHIGKQSLDVGADRIARTAHAALALLERVRARTGQSIPLAWSEDLTATGAIEVYPAATLQARGARSAGYKKRNNDPERREVAEALSAAVTVAPALAERLVTNDDLLDAAVCVLAGVDFLRGDAMPPPDPRIAAKEGWIWVKRLASV